MKDGALQATAHQAADADFSQRVTWSYLLGVYLAVNAIRDLYLLVEGPDCAHMKTQFVQGNHDWRSTLTSVSGFHRVANTGIHPSFMTRSREEAIRDILLRIASHPDAGGVLLTSMPMAYITGADYERLCRDVHARTGRQVVNVPGKSLSGDWIDGYAETLLALARQIQLPEGRRDPTQVAIIGYLYDRNEADHQANVRHLRDLLDRMGLRTVSIWLDGGSFADLAAVSEAGTLISLPYARKAATWIARRTGARVITCDLPFGLQATQEWLRRIGAETGREAAAQTVIEQELARCIPPLEWVAPFVFQGRRVGYMGDPWLAPGIADIARLLGARLTYAVLTNPASHSGPTAAALGATTRVKVWPRARELRTFLDELPPEARPDVVVLNDAGIGLVDGPWVGLGFPSSFSHRLYARPFLGFQGFLALVDSLADQIRRREIVSQGAPGGPDVRVG